jgi:CheY-like chemotaxis protein
MPVQRLLVVEDDPAWREYLGETARAEGCEVALATDGEEALSYLSNRAHPRPDLVVMDLVMPRVDGWELYGRMRTHDELRHIPVLMMSVAQQRVELGGVVGFLQKTVPPETVLAELRERLRRFDVLPPPSEQLWPYSLRFTEEASLALDTLPANLRQLLRQRLFRAAELAAGEELPLMSTWLMALPGTPPSLLVTVEGIRVVLEVNDRARQLTVAVVIIPPHLPRT